MKCAKNDVEEKTTKDIMAIEQKILTSNYFQFKYTTYVQNDGLAMGAPTTSILS